jgi:hypothetical protein
MNQEVLTASQFLKLLLACLLLPSIGFSLSVIAGGSSARSTHRPYGTHAPGRRKK